MNRAEQKERLGELIDLTENTLSGIKNMQEMFDEYVDKYQELYAELENEGLETVLDKDVEEFKADLLRRMLEDNADFGTLEAELESFKSELDDYMEELPPSRAEKIEERYSDWQDIEDKIYSITTENDIDMDSVEEWLKEIVEILKGFKKGR